MHVKLENEIHLIGISLDSKTTNLNGQSNIDCGHLWQQFENYRCFNKIKNKIENNIYAVYYDYEGDHTQPFSYFIGCRVSHENIQNDEFTPLVIPSGSYMVRNAIGKMPDCIAEEWVQIWNSDIPRSFQFDFEIYGPDSQDWSNAKVPIYLSI